MDGSAVSAAGTPGTRRPDRKEPWYGHTRLPEPSRSFTDVGPNWSSNSQGQAGLLHTNNIKELQNLIYLCGGCHHAFDTRLPIWSSVPVAFGHFIAQESALHQARAHTVSIGDSAIPPAPTKHCTTAATKSGHDITSRAQLIKSGYSNRIAPARISPRRLHPLAGGCRRTCGEALIGFRLLEESPPAAIRQ